MPMRIRRTVNGGPPSNLADGQLSVEQLTEPKLWVGTAGPALLIVDAGAYVRRVNGSFTGAVGEFYQAGNVGPLTVRSDNNVSAQIRLQNPARSWRIGPGGGGALQFFDEDSSILPAPQARLTINNFGLVTVTQNLQVNGNLTVNGNVTIHGELWVGGVQIGGSGGAARTPARRRPRKPKGT